MSVSLLFLHCLTRLRLLMKSGEVKCGDEGTAAFDLLMLVNQNHVCIEGETECVKGPDSAIFGSFPSMVSET